MNDSIVSLIDVSLEPIINLGIFGSGSNTFLILKKGESINDYEELPEGEAAQIEQILQEKNSEEPTPEQKVESIE